MGARLNVATLCLPGGLPCGLKRFAGIYSGAGMGRCFVGGAYRIAFSDRPIAPRLLNYKSQSGLFLVAPKRFDKLFLGSV